MPLAAEDFAEINQLHARYCHTVDFGDYDGIVSCFAPDGAFQLRCFPTHASNRQGEDLRNSPTANWSRGHGRHTTLGSMIDGDGDTARSLSSEIGSRDFGPPIGKGRATHSALSIIGIYTDDLVRIEGRWVYAVRRWTRYGSPTLAEDVGKPLEIAHVDAGETEGRMTALDYEAIRQLLVRYGYTLDFEDYDGFVGCFTPDGSYHEVTEEDDEPETRMARGHDELRLIAVAMNDTPFRTHLRRDALSVVIEGDGERARVSSYGLITHDYGVLPETTAHWPSASANVLTSGIFRDEVVKMNGRWLFSKRTFRKDTLPDSRDLVGKPLNLELF